MECDANRWKRRPGKDRLDRELEARGDPHREVERWGVLATFQVADGLIVDPENLRQLSTREPSLGPEDCDAVVQGLGG